MSRVGRIYSFVKRRVLRWRPAPDVLRAEVAELRHRCETLAARQEATQAYYEQRIDLIYRRVTDALGEMLEGRKIIAETPESVANRYRGLYSAGLSVQVSPERLQLGALISGELLRGEIPSPLTFHGFLLHPRIAVEEGDAVRVDGTEVGLALEGPNLRLAPGRYRLAVAIAPVDPSPGGEAEDGTLRIETISYSRDIVAAGEFPVPRQAASLTLRFFWSADDSAKPFSIRIHQKSSRPFRVCSVTLE